MEIKTPIFIIGNPRSGTTFLHRLIAKNKKDFFHFKTWEIIFPCIVQKKILTCIGHFDKLIGSFFSKIILRIERRALGDFLIKHPTGLFYPEEDEILLIHIFSSVYLLFFFPFLNVFEEFVKFDLKVKDRDKKKIMGFYYKCVKKQAYLKGRKKIFISKNPSFCGKVCSIYEHFPECKLIYIYRNPLEVVPSMMSQIMASCIYTLPEKKDVLNRFIASIYDTAKMYYSYPIEMLKRADSSSYVILDYEDIIKNPLFSIETVFSKFGMNITPEYHNLLKIEENKSKEYKSKHKYSLETYGISKEKVLDDCNDFINTLYKMKNSTNF